MRTPAPCGTETAKRRHKRNNETCPNCPPTRKPLAPCGTYMALKRHRKNGQTCETCTAAVTQRNPTPLPDLIEDITFLLNAGEGEHAIVKATGYTGRANTLRDRLNKSGNQDIANRVFNAWELAA